MTLAIDKQTADVTPDMAADLAAYFERFAARALPVAKAVAFKWDPDDIDWEVEEEDLTSLFTRWYARVGTATYELVGEHIGAEVSWDLNQRGVQRVLGSIGERVTGITDTSRDSLARMVDDAISRGLSIDQLVKGETIAATETATAYSLSSVNAYRDSGLIDEVEVLDGEDCGWTEHDDPELADGKIVSLDEAEEYPVAHPNCQRAFAPVAAR
jgi:hypothetical protein